MKYTIDTITGKAEIDVPTASTGIGNKKMNDDVFEALRCCISTKKCNGCPRENTCGITDFRKDNVKISKVLVLDVINKMKEYEQQIDDLQYCVRVGYHANPYVARLGATN